MLESLLMLFGPRFGNPLFEFYKQFAAIMQALSNVSEPLSDEINRNYTVKTVIWCYNVNNDYSATLRYDFPLS